MSNYYDILGLPQTATQREIKVKYMELSLKNHPDRHPDNPQKLEKFKSISVAYSVLSDPEKRAEYDFQLKAEQSEANRSTAEAQYTAQASERTQTQSSYQNTEQTSYTQSSTNTEQTTPSQPSYQREQSTEQTAPTQPDFSSRTFRYTYTKPAPQPSSDDKKPAPQVHMKSPQPEPTQRAFFEPISSFQPVDFAAMILLLLYQIILQQRMLLIFAALMNQALQQSQAQEYTSPRVR